MFEEIQRNGAGEMYLYEIEFKYLDSLKEDWHTAQVVVYDHLTVAGETFAYALDNAESEGDWDGVDKLLTKQLGTNDEEVCFYFDLADLNEYGEERLAMLVPELQNSHDIIIKNIACVNWGEK